MPKRSSKKETVSVFLRLRPLEGHSSSVVKVDDHQVRTESPYGTKAFYKFTKIFDAKAPQKEVFDEVAKPVVEDLIVSAKNGLIFTYGVTASGKTHTMEGLPGDPGLIYRTIDFIFNSIDGYQLERGLIRSNGQNGFKISTSEILYPSACPKTPSVVKWLNRKKEMGRVKPDPERRYTVFISLIELYNKQVIDLFDPDNEKKRIAEDAGKCFVANALEKEVKNSNEAIEYIRKGLSKRNTAATSLNSGSSRSHCVINIKLVRAEKDSEDEITSLVASQLCLVDLAGSERAKRSHTTGATLHEAGYINNSLGALRKCIDALRDRDPNSLPQYREYSLTRLFKSYFEGHGAIKMILCINPRIEEYQENNFAMNFGVLTQNVAIDYASPPKILRPCSNLIEDFGMMSKMLTENIENPDLEEFSKCSLDECLARLFNWAQYKSERSKKVDRAFASISTKVRQDLVETMQELKYKDFKIKSLQSELVEMKTLQDKLREVSNSIGSSSEMTETHSPRIQSPRILSPKTHTATLSEPRTVSTATSSEPMTTTSATLCEPMTTSKSVSRSTLFSSPRGGIPVVNKRHNRSLSTGSLLNILHQPQETVDTGTVFQTCIKNSISVKNPRISDITRKNAAGYSVVHQDADLNGDIETSVFKGQIIHTKCGGAQVIYNDVEKMKQVTP